MNPHALPLDDFAAEVMDLRAREPTPREILVEGVRKHRWAERDGTYDELVAQRSQALAGLPGGRGAGAERGLDGSRRFSAVLGGSRQGLGGGSERRWPA
ncbi:hypothetical protein LRR80_02446 [Streptomyces sp. RO-S4]|nr:hypothetical protein [Streptomyces sp. RO-S4]